MSLASAAEHPQLDYIVVGAGTAGCVLANRLSARLDIRVLLIEAGRDVTPGHEPADIRNPYPISSFNPEYLWPDTRVHWRKADDSPAVPLTQGRVVGGGSAIMGMGAMRGSAADFDEWAAAGARGWDWNGVLPYFKRSENDLDFDGPAHGNGGPLPVRREPPERWSPFALAVRTALQRRGATLIEDMNADFRDGLCVMPSSRYEGSRASSGICYLTASVRARPNLRVEANCTVKRLLVSDGRIVGVTAVRPDGSAISFYARETVLAAGALRTPALLLSSGIGPAAVLSAHGIAVVADAPGVGENLQNHFTLPLVGFLARGRRGPRGRDLIVPALLRYSSGLPGCPSGDMNLLFRTRLSWHAVGGQLATIAPLLTRPMSRGYVRLDPRNPGGAPQCVFNALADARDFDRLKDGVRRALAVAAEPEVAAVCGPMHVLENPAALGRYNRVSSWNAVRMFLAAMAMDLMPKTGQSMVAKAGRMRSAAALFASERELETFVREKITGVGHVAGTCRMGGADDPMAVTDASGRVRSVRCLRVGDASLMPNIPNAGTHVTVVMIAEKIAAAVCRETAGGT